MIKSVVMVSGFEGTIISFKGQLLEDLVNKDYKVYVLAPNFSSDTLNSLKSIGVKPKKISLARGGFNIFRDLIDLIRLSIVIKKIKPEIFIGYYIKPVIWGTLAAYFAKVPKRIVLIEGLGHIFTKSLLKKSLKISVLKFFISFLYRIALFVSTTVFFLNNDDKEEFEQKNIIKIGKGHVLGAIGLKIEEWPNLEPITNPLNFLFIGRLIKEKGLGEFIQAARIIKAKYPGVSFTALGKPESREKEFTYSYLQKLDSEGFVRFPGFVNVRDWMKRSSVFVLPSYREGFPRSAQEAMASGRPVISTNAPGCRDTVIEGKNGFLIEVENVNALVTAIEKFILEPNSIIFMGRESRLIAEKKFDASEINKKIFKAASI